MQQITCLCPSKYSTLLILNLVRFALNFSTTKKLYIIKQVTKLFCAISLVLAIYLCYNSY